MESSTRSGPQRLREAAREGFTLAVGAAVWAFEQGDRLMDTWMAKGSTGQVESRRRLENFAARARAGVRQATNSMPVATREQVASLERRIDELSRQVEALRHQP